MEGSENKMDLRTLYYPFRKESNVKMAYMYIYEVRAVPLSDVEGALSKRLARETCRLAKHLEARDILMFIMGYSRDVASRLQPNFEGVHLIELAIGDICEKMYEENWNVHIEYPENKTEIMTRYRFECKFSTLVTK